MIKLVNSVRMIYLRLISIIRLMTGIYSKKAIYYLHEPGPCCGLVKPAYQASSVGKTSIPVSIRAHVSDEADAGFIFQSTLTERYKQFVLLTSQRSGQPGINAQEYSDLLLPLPSLMEQRRIGAFFDRLDSLITLHQRKYDGCANPLFSERRISCRKPSHQNRCSATTTPSG